ncbi:LysM domain-containing protein [Bacillus sp. JJ1533]|uniref:LysM peptidoglycan-binding domain-containing protein n=1 Tax=Bacillus sp. JJ1533 TaxID=3122959 RepID=UPI002FFFE235
MKRFFAFLAFVFIIFIIYYDMRIGTLPVAKNEPIEATEVIAQTTDDPYKKITVKAGDTLLSIVEKVNEGTRITSIESVINDFEELNPESKAELLQIGKTYKFPLYTNE